MKFGIFDHMDRAAGSIAEQYEDRLRLIEAYERAGFRSYHLAEHHATPLGMAPAPSVFLAAVAQRTTRLRFGPLVYPLAFHHPLRVFEEACMLDQLSGGRLELGIGRGASPHEMRYYGIDPTEAQARYHEAYAVLLAAMQSPTLNFEGKHYVFRDVPIEIAPVQRPHPPLWYGVANQDGAAWAARNAINIVCNGPAAAVRQMSERYRAEWTAAGNDMAHLPLIGMSRFVVIAQSDAEAVAIARRGYARWYAGFIVLWTRHGTRPLNAAYPDNLDEARRIGFVVAGTPERVCDLLQAQIAESAINYAICRFAFGDLTFDEALRSLELFAALVMPTLAGHREAAE